MTKLDPVLRIEVLMKEQGISYSDAAAIVFGEAHLDNFETAYEEPFGAEARGIGATRNIGGQGMPGTDALYRNEKRK